jgi:hypothetical protein
MQAQPFYSTTNDAQAKYYWGSAPMQTGATYNAQLANNIPQAPIAPWGIQEVAQPLTAEQLMAALQQQQNLQQVQPGYAIPPEWLQQWRNI